MEDLLSAVKTVRVPEDDESTPQLVPSDILPLRERNHQSGSSAKRPVQHGDGPESVLHLLRSEPDHKTLIEVLLKLQSHRLPRGFDIRIAGPLQAQIVNALVSNIISNYWRTLEPKEKILLSTSLRSLSGINAVISKLKLLASSNLKEDSTALHASDLVGVLEHILASDDILIELWKSSGDSGSTKAKNDLAWKEIANVLGSGKVVSIVAQVENILRSHESATSTRSSWLSSGSEYAAWIGRSLGMFVVNDEVRDKDGDAALLLTRALSLGYPSRLLRESLRIVLRGLKPKVQSHPLEFPLLKAVPSYAKRQFLDHILRWLSESVPSDPHSRSLNGSETDGSKKIAALISKAIEAEPVLQDHLLACLGDVTNLTSLSIAVKRACLAVASNSNLEGMQALLEKLMSTIGDPLFIKQTPVLQQESAIQTLLMVAGYVHRSEPMALLLIARSSGHMSGISNRLDSSLYRPRWLGMVLGTSISALVDKEGSKMSFGTEDMDTEEAKFYTSLSKVQDPVGSLADALSLCESPSRTTRPRQPRQKDVSSEELPVIKGKQVFGPVRPPRPVQTEVVGDKVSELPDEDSDTSANGLQPYAKPDSDPEDSDDDATLVNRDKARAPVYIRDLMAMLRDDKAPDRFQMGIKHAAPLIRRKKDFGKEVKDHAEEILSVLCNLQDPFSTPEFDEMRLQAMIAALLSDPEVLCPWFARQSFAGEHSISQRCIMLSALGLAGRELAGFRTEDENLNPDFALSDPATNFPSKRLPPRLHALYSGNTTTSTKRLNSAARNVEQQLIKPLALHAADKSTSHLDAVKVRTFSSRLSNPSNRTTRKPPPNTLTRLLASALFYPLMTRYQQDISAYSTASLFASVPLLLTTYLRTLALLLHASGPATINLGPLSTDFWDLLLSLRTPAAQDKSVLEAVLFCLLTLLEVNGEAPGGSRRLAGENARQLMETQEWVEVVFERTGAAGERGAWIVEEDRGGGEEAKIRTLAAGVLVRAREVVEARQTELFGRVI